MRISFRALVLSISLALAGAAFAQALPSDSVYQLDVPLSDQNGHAFKLKEHAGKPMLVSMFYTSCKFVCPMLIDSMQHTQEGLTSQERAQLDVLLVTFDPERDDVAKLKSVAVSRHVDGGAWTLARTDASNSRKLAATLGIQYRLLADGEFNHTTVMVLLDSQGRIVGRSKKMGVPDPEFIQLVQKTIGPVEWVHGQVAEAPVPGQITLKHEAIKSLGMGAMTMPFQVGERVALKGFKAGDKVRFQAHAEGDFIKIDALEHSP